MRRIPFSFFPKIIMQVNEGSKGPDIALEQLCNCVYLIFLLNFQKKLPSEVVSDFSNISQKDLKDHPKMMLYIIAGFRTLLLMP